MTKRQAIPALTVAALAVLAATHLPPPPTTAESAPARAAEPSPAKAIAETPNPQAPPLPPDLQALAGRLGAGTLPPTPAQIEEERRVEREQVADAVKSLRSPDVEERVGGAQQLAAYPTREAERQLAAALAGDADPAVREAAALSLAYAQAPESRTIDALLHGLLDVSEEPRAAALQTLEGYLNRMDAESAGFRRIRKGLAGILKSRKLAGETRQGIRDLLADTGA